MGPSASKKEVVWRRVLSVPNTPVQTSRTPPNQMLESSNQPKVWRCMTRRPLSPTTVVSQSCGGYPLPLRHHPRTSLTSRSNPSSCSNRRLMAVTAVLLTGCVSCRAPWLCHHIQRAEHSVASLHRLLMHLLPPSCPRHANLL